MQNEIRRAHLLVTGLVQGVGMRYFAHVQGSALGLTGFARNLVNGNVEIEAQGEERHIQLFVERIRSGPTAAVVQEVELTWIPPLKNESGFGTT